MSIHFAATSLADFRSRNAAIGFVSSASEIGPYVFEGISQGDGAETSTPFPQVAHGAINDELWMHCYIGGAGGSGHDVEWTIYDSAGEPVYQLDFDNGGGGGIRIEVWDGSAWQTLHTSTTSVANNHVDVQFIVGLTTGAIRLYIGNSLDSEVTGINTNLGTSNNVGQTELDAPSTSGGDGFHISEMLITDEDTRNWLFVHENKTGEVLNTMASGGFADVNDTPGIDADTFALADADGQKLTLAGTFDSVIDSGYDVAAVVTSVNYNRIGSLNSGLKSLDVISSTEYTSAEVPVDEGVGVVQFIQDLSPATGVAWTAAEVQASEAGVESA